MRFSYSTLTNYLFCNIGVTHQILQNHRCNYLWFHINILNTDKLTSAVEWASLITLICMELFGGACTATK